MLKRAISLETDAATLGALREAARSGFFQLALELAQ